MSETFRLRKSVKYQAMGFSALFLAAVAWSASIFFLDEPAQHGFKGEHSVAIVGGMGVAVFGAFLLMSIYMWAAYYVERFTIDGTSLSIRSMFQDRQFDVSELQSLTWRTRPLGGSIVFETSVAKARLDLFGYASEDRLRIIRGVHELVPDSIQQGWSDFCNRVNGVSKQNGNAP